MSFKVTRSRPINKLLEVPALIKEGLGMYNHLQELLTFMNDVPENIKLEDYVENVRRTSIRNLSLATHRENYIQYLQNLEPLAWEVHLRSVRKMQMGVKKYAELHLQRAATVSAPDRDDSIPDPEAEPMGDKRARDGED